MDSGANAIYFPQEFVSLLTDFTPLRLKIVLADKVSCLYSIGVGYFGLLRVIVVPTISPLISESYLCSNFPIEIRKHDSLCFILDRDLLISL